MGGGWGGGGSLRPDGFAEAKPRPLPGTLTSTLLVDLTSFFTFLSEANQHHVPILKIKWRFQFAFEKASFDLSPFFLFFLNEQRPVHSSVGETSSGER